MNKEDRLVCLTMDDLNHIIENLFFYGTTYSENYKHSIDQKNKEIITKIKKQIKGLK